MNKLYKLLPALTFAILYVSVSRSQTALVVDSSFAPSLNRTMKYAVLLPHGYQPSQRYPVLYLLHGLNGTHREWGARTKLPMYAVPYRMLIVMPDAEASWYVNARHVENDRFEDFIVDDLPRIVASKYGIDTGRAAIAGYSMGGYGAIMLALRHPHQFRFAGSLSGAIDFPRGAESYRAGASPQNVKVFQEVFGKDPDWFYDEHDILQLATLAEREELPYLYFAAGIQDGFATFLPAHRKLMDLLRARDIAYEYHETPGKHDWAFWDREVQPMLEKAGKVLGATKPN
jgi:S-formylglutathione hydrolase FrmB